MTDFRQGEDPSLASFGRHVLIGCVLGLCVGASWEIMAGFWAAGQFAPRRLLILGAALGLAGGFLTWLARAGRERPRATDRNSPRRQSAIPADALRSSSRPNGVRPTWTSFLAFVAAGAVCGIVCAPSYASTYWTTSAGQRVFAIVGCIVLGAAAGAFVWIARVGLADANAARTSRRGDPMDPVKSPVAPPPAFEQRLAAFLHCTTEELHAPRPRPQSTMPFWSIVDFASYVGPKPAWIIRRILERIRATLRRSRYYP
jgi:hypothetical protein